MHIVVESSKLSYLSCSLPGVYIGELLLLSNNFWVTSNLRLVLTIFASLPCAIFHGVPVLN